MDVIFGCESEIVSTQGDDEARQRLQLVAVDGVLLPTQHGCGASCLGQLADSSWRTCQEGGATVDDCLLWISNNLKISELHRVQPHLPVCLGRQRYVHQVTCEVIWIHTAKAELTLFRWIVLQEEGKDGFIEELLIYHGLKGGWDV